MNRSTLLGRFFACLILFGMGAAVVVVFAIPSKARPREEAPERPRVPVKVYTPTLEDIDIIDTYAGLIEPMRRYTLSFEVGGKIHRLGSGAAGRPLDVGDWLKKGDLIAELDDRKLRAQDDESEAQLGLARDLLARNRSLRQSKSVSEEAVQTSLTEVAMWQARVELARETLGDAILAAPVDGVVAKRFINDGESVAPNQPVLEMLEVFRVLLVIGVPESRVLRLAEGLPVDVELLGRDVTGARRDNLKGTIRKIFPDADETFGLFRVEVLLDNPDGVLKPGLVARAHINVDTVKGYRLWPDSAVLDRSDFYLYAIDADQRARRYPLADAVRQDNDLIVTQLPEGANRIVVRGQRRLAPGVLVEVVSEGPREHIDENFSLGLQTNSEE